MRHNLCCWLILVCVAGQITTAFADSAPLSPEAVFAETSIPEDRSSDQTRGELQPASFWEAVTEPFEPNAAAMAPCVEPTRVFVAPYVWVPAMKGTVTALGMTDEVDLSLGDAFSLLGDMKGAAQGHVEIGRGDWTLILDTMLMRLGTSTSVPIGRLEADVGATFLEVMAARRIGGELLKNRGVLFEVLGGARYYQVDAGITLNPDNPMLPLIPSEQTEEWVDLVFGARAVAPLTPRLRGFTRGDFAGFGIGTSSTLTWNLTAGVEYAHTDACWWSLGYRILDIDEAQTSAGRAFAFDVRLHGPFLALMFRY